MPAVSLLAAVTGTGTAAGLACVIAAFVLPPRATTAPPPRWRLLLTRWRVSGRTAALAVAAGLAALAITGWPVAGLATVPAVITLPRILSRRPARARIATLEALESWTRRLADLLAASRGLEDAITHSAATAPPPIAAAVAGLARAVGGRTATETALRAFADAINDPVGDLIATALLLATEQRGPGVHDVLTELAGDVAKDVAARREVEAERASYRTTLAWIIAFVLAYTLYLVLRRNYAAPFGTPLGQFVLAVVAGCYAGGIYWLHRLSLAAGPSRFLHQRSPNQEKSPTAPASRPEPVRQP